MRENKIMNRGQKSATVCHFSPAMFLLEIVFIITVTLFDSRAETVREGDLPNDHKVVSTAILALIAVKSGDSIGNDVFANLEYVFSFKPNNKEDKLSASEQERLDSCRRRIAIELAKRKAPDTDSIIDKYCNHGIGYSYEDRHTYFKRCVSELYPPSRSQEVLSVSVPEKFGETILINWRYTDSGRPHSAYGGSIKLEKRRTFEGKEYWLPVWRSGLFFE